MRIAVIGGGASGLDGAIAIKKKRPEAEIVVFEKEEKIARKLYATGNGHCNLLNAKLIPGSYNHPSFVGPYLERYPFAQLENTLNSWGILTLHQEDYVYPLSYQAASYVDFLLALAKILGIRLLAGVRVLDYLKTDDGFVLKTSPNFAQTNLVFDKIIFATGGASMPKLGSDGTIFSLLKRHGYPIVEPLPGLAPIQVKHPETLKGLNGYRHEANVHLLSREGKLLYEERGEVLYKEDGLSGIVIFNVESAYCRLSRPAGASLSLDLFPDQRLADLADQLAQSRALNPSFYGDAFFPKEIQAHFRFSQTTDGFVSLAQRLKNDAYSIKGVYGFDHSQATVGGVALSAVKENLESRLEDGVYFVGEVLDIDGFCGGFNLAWALLSALIVRDSL